MSQLDRLEFPTTIFLKWNNSIKSYASPNEGRSTLEMDVKALKECQFDVPNSVDCSGNVFDGSIKPLHW